MKKRAEKRSDTEYLASYGVGYGVDPLVDGEGGSFEVLENMYVDYEGGADAIESMPGFRRLYSFEGRINGIYSHRKDGEEYVIVHAGDGVYRFKKEDRDSLSDTPPERIATARDERSRLLSLGDKLLLLDGEGILIIDGEGATRFTEGSSLAYRPTTYIDGIENEKRNLFSNEFTEIFNVKSISSLTHGTRGLTYEITNESDRICTVTGVQGMINGSLYIPGAVTIDGREYKVGSVSDWAFRNQEGITALYTSLPLSYIGDCAFYGCTALETAVLSVSVTSIGNYAFSGCTSLKTVYLGGALLSVKTNLFYGCTALRSIHFLGSAAALEKIEGNEAFSEIEIVYGSVYSELLVEIPVHTVDGVITDVRVGSRSLEFTHDKSLRALLISIPSRSSLEGGVLTVFGRFGSGDAGGFLSTDIARREGAHSEIFSPRVAEVFDGRLFLSGNPTLGGAVFYSAKSVSGLADPFYFPIDNFFIDGTGDAATVDMLSAEDSLFVFLEKDEGDGCVFRHREENGRYDRVFFRRGGGALPSALEFSGEILFLSDTGVGAIASLTQNGFDISSRSLAIEKRLSASKKRRLLSRLGSYIALASGSEIFLGDSRSVYKKDGALQYAWYPLTSVATYVGDSRVYRYSETAPEGYLVWEKPREVAEGVVMSVGDGSGGLIYYVEISKKKYAVYPTDEFSGGTPSDISALLGGDILFFGTYDGSLCLFNTDKRGVAPEEISSAEGFDPEEYRRAMGDKIHPYFYSYDRHAPRYALLTESEDAEAPYMLKSTVASSLTVGYKTLGDGPITVEVATDKEVFKRLISTPVGGLDFSAFDLSRLSLSPFGKGSVTLPDPTRGWLEKQVAIYSDAYCSPIAIRRIHYRYKIKGRIK